MLTGTLVFFLLLVLVLAIPVTVTFELAWPQTVENRVRLIWAFGLVRVRIAADGMSVRSVGDKKPAGKARRHKRSARESGSFLSVIRNRALRRRITKFVRDSWHAVRKENVKLRFRLGLDDPAYTGQLWAFLGPLAGILSRVRAAAIEIQPEFHEEIFEIDCSGIIRIIPLRMVYVVTPLLLSPSVWRGMRTMRAQR